MGRQSQPSDLQMAGAARGIYINELMHIPQVEQFEE